MDNITCQILCGDELVSIEDSEIIEDMRVLNYRGNQDNSKFQVLWDATARVIETYSGTGAQLRLHAASNK